VFAVPTVKATKPLKAAAVKTSPVTAGNPVAIISP
jgi:hypothetical protein